MVLKKKIKVHPRNTSNEQDYNHRAGICPICGTDLINRQEYSQFMGFEYDRVLVLYVVTHKKMTFFCPTCGCSWSIKLFKKDKKAK